MRDAAQAVGINDTLYFFISGRGRTEPDMAEGYIDAYESPQDVRDTASVPISQILTILNAMMRDQQPFRV